jgi:hypothetical protein
MRILKTIFITVVLVFVFISCFEDNSFARVVNEEKTLTFKGVDQFALANVTGKVEVMGWDKDHVEVSYRKKAANESLLERLRVIPRQEGREVDIDTDYPRRCRRCSISFKVFVPRSMEKIEIKTVTGKVSFKGLDYIKNAKAKTVTGSIGVELSCRDCDLHSVTGSIRAEFEKIDQGGEISASLTTGAIKLYLPDDFSGRVSLKTVTGRVETDFPITITGTLKRNKIKGSIGKGSSRISAHTVTGSIRLLKK